MAYFDDLFLTNLREAMTAAGEGEGRKGRNSRTPRATSASSSVRSKTSLRKRSM